MLVCGHVFICLFSIFLSCSSLCVYALCGFLSFSFAKTHAFKINPNNPCLQLCAEHYLCYTVSIKLYSPSPSHTGCHETSHPLQSCVEHFLCYTCKVWRVWRRSHWSCQVVKLGSVYGLRRSASPSEL